MDWKASDDAALIETLATALAQATGLTAVFLSGSHGRGSADRFSDIDLVGLTDNRTAAVAALHAALEAGPGVVYFQELFGGRLCNAITPEWRRVDLFLPDGLEGHAQNLLVPLHDPVGLHATLPEALPPAAPSPARVSSITNEFLRVLGLLHVGAGRGEDVLLVRGLGILRDKLAELMLEEVPEPDKGGALHPSRLLPPEDMAILIALPCPGPDRAALLAGYAEVAGGFLPRARALHTRIGLDWPGAFEAATRAVLRRELALELP